MQVVVINGNGGCGKDTFVDLCSKYCYCTQMSAVDIVKNMATLAGWDGTKTEKTRKYLSELNKLNNTYFDTSMKSMEKYIKNIYFQDVPYDICFLHIREPENIKRAVDLFKAKTLLIKRPDTELITSNNSDANVEKYPYDYIVLNDGNLNDLEDKASNFTKQLLGESL